VSSGPKYRKLGKIVDTVNAGYASSSVVGASSSGLAVDGSEVTNDPKDAFGVCGGVKYGVMKFLGSLSPGDKGLFPSVGVTGEWLEWTSLRWPGEGGTWSLRVGGAARVADRIGLFRGVGLGRLVVFKVSRSMDLDAIRVSGGAVGRRIGGGGRRKPIIDEGGGEGESESMVADIEGITGSGDRALGKGSGGRRRVDEPGSSSGRGLLLRSVVELVSS